MKLKSPVSSQYQIEFDVQTSCANVDLTNISDSKTFFNSIINTIIAIYQNYPDSKLKSISFTHSPKQAKDYKVLCRQMDLFSIAFNNVAISNDKFCFDEKWKNNIENGININFSKWDNLLSKYKDLLPYKTVTSKKIQLRYFGYQIATFDPAKDPILANIVLENDRKGNENFNDHFDYIAKTRMDASNSEKQEHFLESRILQKLNDYTLDITGKKIEKLFATKLNFQFPTLLDTTDKSLGGNSPKYVDVFAKYDNRPVIMELKVHENSKNSRGAYVFQAYGQLLNYYIYLRSVFTDLSQTWGPHLSSVKNLNWESPILYIIVDCLGKDTKSDEFREYIKIVKGYFKQSIDVRFVEVGNNYKQHLSFTNEI